MLGFLGFFDGNVWFDSFCGFFGGGIYDRVFCCGLMKCGLLLCSVRFGVENGVRCLRKLSNFMIGELWKKWVIGCLI